MKRSYARHRDEGSALLLVVGVMTTLIVLVSVALSAAQNTQGVAQRSRSWNQAMAAAQSGVEDYLARLNTNDLYWNTVDCTNPALPKPTSGSVRPCGWGPATPVGWASVPGAVGGAYPSEFHYDVVTTNTPVNGTIDLTVTGRAGSVSRTVSVVLRRGGFGEFLYYTTYETTDPANEVAYRPSDGRTADQVAADCTHYWWEPRNSSTGSKRGSSSCKEIQFAPGDEINGPLHSNDTLLIGGGAKFTGTATTSDPACFSPSGGTVPVSQCYRPTGSGSPEFQRGLTYRDPLDLPETVNDLRQFVTPGRTDNLGCLYTGPTRLKFLQPASGATPKMRVWSRWSAATSLNPGCGTATDLRSGSGALIEVPNNKLILVQNVPATQKSPDPVPPSDACTAGAIGDGLPVANDYGSTLSESKCTYGTAYIEGNLKGRVTISADNNVIVTGDLKYVGGQNGQDALGLVAGNSVKVYHPVEQTLACRNRGVYDNNGAEYFYNCRFNDSTMRGYFGCSDRTNYTYQGSSAYRIASCDEIGTYANLSRPNGGVFQNPAVYASILTLQHSFGVQVYDKGDSLGTLTVFGSIAQRYRGPVGTSNSSGAASGYLKNYNYDSRLRYSPPPYFLDPVRASWGQKTFGEVAARYPAR